MLEILLKEYTVREKEALQVSSGQAISDKLVIVQCFCILHIFSELRNNSGIVSFQTVYLDLFMLQVLSLEAEASLEEITRSYRELAKTWHPDHNPNKDAEAMFVKVHEAYEVLLQRHRPRRFK